jgi:hypothetical protein
MMEWAQVITAGLIGAVIPTITGLILAARAFGRLEGRLVGLEGLVGGLGNHLSGVEARLASLDSRMTSLDERMGALETRIGRVEGVLEGGGFLTPE